MKNVSCPLLTSGVTGAHKGLDLEVLFQGFKEDLNLPAVFVDGSNGRGPQFQVIGQKDQDLPGLRIIDLNPSKRVRASSRWPWVL